MNIISTKKYNIIIADDHMVVREGLRNAINKSGRFHVIKEFSNGKELLENLREFDCDLLILDISMPEVNGIQVLEELHLRFPELKILILTMHKERVYIKQALRRGISGYLLKSDPLDDLLIAMNEVLGGKIYFSKQIMPEIIEDYAQFMDRHKVIDELSEREIEVLKLIANGLSVRKVSEQLNISPRTVESHKYKIMEKLQINNMTELIKFSVLNNII
jgi:RNA polymerase sigma factor (sigma-70 family)